MPATVRVSPSARSGLRAVLIIAAAVLLLIPLAVTVANATSRLSFTKLETSEELPASTRDIRVSLDTGADVAVRTGDVRTPEVTLTGVGPRDNLPQLRVDDSEGTSTISVDDVTSFEKARLQVTVPQPTSKDTNLEFSGGLGDTSVVGEYNEVRAETEGSSITLDGTFNRVQTTTQWGQTTLKGTYGTVEAKSDTGTIDGSDLRVRERIDATSSAGSISFDFSNDMVPAAGITAKSDEGTIDLRLPRLELVKANMTRPDGDDQNASDAEAGELFYQITAKSNQGRVDLKKDLEKYDATKNSKDAEGKTVIPVSATSDQGAVTIDQN
ncbi:hypothetical protein KACC15558_24260 [Brevibacterium ammoniilyticum]|uniref:Adhesin domain-containing protein n=1 Tax=Brevibacterium ammoniilyticum TaxID=1046555 RepID=A0ABP9U6W6_9MICO